MPSYLLDKTIPVDEEIESIDSVVIDDHFTYVTLYEGIRVQGQIGISLVAHDKEEKFPLSDTLEVDILCPNDQICDCRGVHLRVDDSSYEIGDHAVIFHIKCVLEGSDIVEEEFSLEKEKKESFLHIEEPPKELSLDKARTFLDPSQMEELESLLGKEDVTMISTMEEKEETPKEKEEKKEEPVIVNPPLEEDGSLMVGRKKESLFQNEPMMVITSYYRVQKDDSYASIAVLYHMDETKLRKDNHHKELKIGDLLLIKR